MSESSASAAGSVPVLPPLSFNTPADIKVYGREVIQPFNTAMKSIAAILDGVGQAQESIVGEGPYNAIRAKDADYILFGKDEHDRNKHVRKGLFGAFGIVHLPEVQMYYHMPKMLAKHGFRLLANYNGREWEIDLKTLSLDFIPRRSAHPIYGKKDNGCITLGSEAKYKDGVEIEKEVKTTLFNPDNPSETLEIAGGVPVIHGKAYIDNPTTPRIRLVDKNGNPCNTDLIVAPLLWGHIQAHQGLKRQGRDTNEFYTLAFDGVDDDFTAEEKLIKALESLKRQHNTDLMPEFNGSVATARNALQNRPDLLQTIADALALRYVYEESSSRELSSLRDYYCTLHQSFLPLNHRNGRHTSEEAKRIFGQDPKVIEKILSTARQELLGAVQRLGVALPSPSSVPDLSGDITNEFLERCIEKAEGVLSELMIQSQLPQIQSLHPLDTEWLVEGGRQIVIPVPERLLESGFRHRFEQRNRNTINDIVPRSARNNLSETLQNITKTLRPLTGKRNKGFLANEADEYLSQATAMVASLTNDAQKGFPKDRSLKEFADILPQMRAHAERISDCFTQVYQTIQAQDKPMRSKQKSLGKISSKADRSAKEFRKAISQWENLDNFLRAADYSTANIRDAYRQAHIVFAAPLIAEPSTPDHAETEAGGPPTQVQAMSVTHNGEVVQLPVQEHLAHSP